MGFAKNQEKLTWTEGEKNTTTYSFHRGQAFDHW